MKACNNILFLLFVTTFFVVAGCTKSDVLTSYEEVKEEELVPLSFTPYISTAGGEGATTRADVDAFIYYGKANETNYYSKIPAYNQKRHDGGGTDDLAAGNDLKNNYIVGIFGYNYNNNYKYTTDNRMMKWYDFVTGRIPNDTITPNFMINQPLRHTQWQPNGGQEVWEYSPIKYWPNNNKSYNPEFKTNVVTFIAYYPFQDYQGKEYYLDGNNGKVDYRNNIIPPSNTATGEDAYTFTFTQKEKPEEQIDFLMGINPDQAKTSATISLKLQHALNAIQFGVLLEGLIKKDNTDQYEIQNANTTGKANPAISELDSIDEVDFKVNSITLKNVINSGKVYWTSNYSNKAYAATPSLKWTLLEGEGYPRKDYTIDFTTGKNLDYQPKYRKYWNGSKYVAEYQCLGDWRQLVQKDYNAARNILLVIPQNMTGYTLVVNFDLTYTYRGGGEPHTVSYKNITETTALKNFGYTNPGYRIGANLKFHIHPINMDGSVGNWVDVDVEEIEPDDSNNQTP